MPPLAPNRRVPSLRVLVCLLGLGAVASSRLGAGDAIVPFVVTPQAQPYEERHRATYRIGKNLVAEDVATLLAFLGRSREQDSIRESELRTLKNNVADALIAQNKPEASLVDAFITLASAPAQDEAWREYLLQKLPDLALRFENAELRAHVTEFLRGQTAVTDYIFAGTSLLALQRLGAADPSLVGPVEIARRAVAILDDPKQANACKIAALQVLGASDAAEGRRRAVLALQDDATPIMLKVSALATLGEHGQGDDAAYLSRYEASPDYRLRTAARAAASKLKKRGGE